MFNTASDASGCPRLPPAEVMCYCKHVRGKTLSTEWLHSCEGGRRSLNQAWAAGSKWPGRDVRPHAERKREIKKKWERAPGENKGQGNKARSVEEEGRKTMKTETEINLRRQRDTDYREHRGERGWLLKNAYVSVWRRGGNFLLSRKRREDSRWSIITQERLKETLPASWNQARTEERVKGWKEKKKRKLWRCPEAALSLPRDAI